jgi:hypothetical protein
VIENYGNYTKKKKATKKLTTVVEKTTKDYSNDPYFIKKRARSLNLLKKTGLPESFTKK